MVKSESRPDGSAVAADASAASDATATSNVSTREEAATEGGELKAEQFQTPLYDTIVKNAQDYSVRKQSSNLINWRQLLVVDGWRIVVAICVVFAAQLVHQALIAMGLYDFDISIETAQTALVQMQVLVFQVYDELNNHAEEVLALLSPLAKLMAVMIVCSFWVLHRQNPVYLMSFATFKPPESWKVSHEQIIHIMSKEPVTEESLGFMKKILDRSGTGQATAWPPCITQALEPGKRYDPSMKLARKEAETVIYDAVQQALDKANVRAKDIDVLVINCSLFSPTPSLCAMVMSHFGMRADVATFNLSGMGCSASLISIDLAKQLLASASSKHRKALVVSTEILTPNLYLGNDRGYLVQNTLFRCGAAAMVLSNVWLDRPRAWYKLLHTVRVQGTDDTSYEAVFEDTDEKGIRGVRLTKDIVKVAGKCMEKNFTTLGPSVLPVSEVVLVVGYAFTRYVLKKLSKIFKSVGKNDWVVSLPLVKPYVPDFKKGIDHFCIHAGGRAVIDGIEKNLCLEPYHTEPSRMTLYNYGNTSSSSIWYELEYIQEHQTTNDLKKGDKVLQVAFGSGFKCTSAVWQKL